MGLEDLAMFRALPTATIFYPCDGVSTEKAVELAATTKVYNNTKVQCFPTASVEHIYYKKKYIIFSLTQGVCYIRTSRQDSAIIYNSNEDFHVGQAKVKNLGTFRARQWV